nr:MFS transporter [Sphingobium sp. JAI105]
MIAILVIIYTFSTLDRSILAIMVTDVKADLNFSDTEMALLSGTAFAIFYTTIGLPMGALADSKPRRAVIFWAASFWAACSSLIAFSTHFTQFFLSRMGVGAAESALGPAAYSMISDRFPRKRLSGAIGVYSVGGIMGAGLSYALGGYLLSKFPEWKHVLPGPLSGWPAWRLVLLVTGLPGVLLALLIFTFPEPARRRSRHHSDADWRSFFRLIGGDKRLFAQLLIAWGLIGMIAIGISAWAPTYLRRAYGLSPVQAGAAIGGIIAFSGVTAHLVNGFIVDWIASKGYRDAPIRFFVVSALIATPFVVMGFLVHSLPLFLFGFAMKNLLLTPITGYASASVQMITPPSLRGRAGALFLMVFNILGVGFGPLTVGWLTDHAWGDPSRIGWSLALLTGVCATLAIILLVTIRRRFIARIALEETAAAGDLAA